MILTTWLSRRTSSANISVPAAAGKANSNAARSLGPRQANNRAPVMHVYEKKTNKKENEVVTKCAWNLKASDKS